MTSPACTHPALTLVVVEFVGDPYAMMFYASEKFRDEIFHAYGAKLIGWPAGIEFVNPSDMKNPTAKVRALLDAWADGTMRWAWVSQDEFIAGIYDLRSACPGPHFPNPIPRSGRNDIKKRRARAIDAECEKYPPRFVRDGPKSFQCVSEEMERGLWPVTTWASIGMLMIGRGEAADEHTVPAARKDVPGPALPPRWQLHGELPEDPITYF